MGSGEWEVGLGTGRGKREEVRKGRKGKREGKRERGKTGVKEEGGEQVSLKSPLVLRMHSDGVDHERRGLERTEEESEGRRRRVYLQEEWRERTVAASRLGCKFSVIPKILKFLLKLLEF